MATTVVVVPDIGDIDDIPIIEILVSTGEAVEIDQPLITLESDKATMDVPAPQAGVVGAIKVAIGDSVSRGATLLELETETTADEPAPAAANRQTTSLATGPVASPVQQAHDDAEETVTAPATATQTSNAVDRAPVSNPNAIQRRESPTLEMQPPDPASTGSRTLHASPAIRRFARTLGVELPDVSATGYKGRVLRTDVERQVKEVMLRSKTAQSVSSNGAGISPIPAIDFSKFGPVQTQALSRIKRISGPFLQRAWLNVPHVTYEDETDITELEAFRQSLKGDPSTRDTRVTLIPFVIKALSAALHEFPVFNSSLSPDGQELILKQYFHIGVAVDTPNGLVVPVLRNVERKGILAIAEELAEISSRAREGKLKAHEMQGGCMSISSLGGIGGTRFTPLVNAPEVAILGIPRSKMTPVWSGAEFVPRLMLPLCLSFDHRVVDGAESARFMSFLCRQLSDIRKLLL